MIRGCSLFKASCYLVKFISIGKGVAFFQIIGVWGLFIAMTTTKNKLESNDIIIMKF